MKTEIAFISALVVSTGALAANTANSQNHEALFDQFDANGDSLVTMQEASASITLSEQFESLDADDSGDLTLAEFESLEIASGMEGQGES